MELKYIWIKDYKNLRNIGFNFDYSGDEKFEYKNEELKITKIKNKVPKDFFAKNIKGVTAIVGENGSGKTNFSEYLNYNLAHVDNGGLSYSGRKSQGIIVIDKIIFIHEKIELKNKNELEDLGYKISHFEKVPLDISQNEKRWWEMAMNKYIYYSPVFDFRITDHIENLINISTSYLINYDIYQSSKYKINHSSYGSKEKTDSLYAHYRNEKIRESDIILEYSEVNRLIPNIPSTIYLYIDKLKENKLLEIPYYSKEDIKKDSKKGNIKRSFSELTNLESRYNQIQDWEEYKNDKKEETGYEFYTIPADIRKESFRSLFLINFLKIFLSIENISFKEGFAEKFINGDKFKINDNKIESDLIKLRENLSHLISLSDWLETENRIPNGSYNWEDQADKTFDMFRELSFTIDSPKKRKLIKHLIEQVRLLLHGNTHFYYEFEHELSSGQQYLLNFYSRFFWAKNQILEIEKGDLGIKGERIIIFIDEGEIALHPEWQRKYFKLITEYLSDLFKDREIQLIITTHSPFVLSDLPKENIIFLEKDDKGMAVQSSLERDKTFGANIYTLLSDSFFMENGTIGEFAKEKIEWVLKELDKEGSIKDDKLIDIDFIIDNIGEPLIKMQLESLRSKKVNETEVEVLRNRVKELENQSEERSNDKD